MFSEMEVQASPAADLPGNWVLKIYNENVLWTQIPFEIVSEGSSSGSTGDTSKTIIRGYYIFVNDVEIVGDVVLGQNVTVEMTIEYNYPILSPLVPSIFNEDFEPIADASDEIQGSGETTYTLSMRTSPGDDAKTFYAVAYFYVDGNWRFMESGGYMPFTISADGSGSSILPDNFELPDIDIDQITSTLNQTFQQGLDLLKNIEIPDEVAQIEEEIKERTGIPGFPVEAILMGAAAVGLALRKGLSPPFFIHQPFFSSMDEAEFLVDQLRTTFNGDSWHGPNLVKTLDGIGLFDAGTRYLEDRHTIWELANHITYWIEEVYSSVKDVTALNHEGNDWPEMGVTEEEWARVSSRLEEAVKLGVPDIPMEWCYCSAGYGKLRYDVAFGVDTEVEMLESVFSGSDKCRFRYKIPEKFR